MTTVRQSGEEEQYTAILISLSPLADDPRVRRLGDFLHANGWCVIGIGISGAKSFPPEWQIFEAVEPTRTVDDLKPKMVLLPKVIACALGLVPSLLAAGTIAAAGIGLLLLRSAWGRRAFRTARNLLDPVATLEKVRHYVMLWLSARVAADAAYRELERQRPLLRSMRQVALKHGRQGLWIANDWLMLPLAAAGARRWRGAYAYDSHEFATHEFSQKWDWYLFWRPLVERVEGQYIRGASAVTSVSPEITEALTVKYRLTAPTATLRNLPRYQENKFRAVGADVRVLYHGILTSGRGLEAAIESVAHWPDRFRLTIRGPGDETYISYLSAIAARHGVTHRIAIEPPLPASDLVRAAAAYDIGLMALPGHSLHNAYALPNKVYEYLMAGLALCVTDLPSMAKVVHHTGAGVLCGQGGPLEIAEAMRALSPQLINVLKANALRSARQLHFEVDAKPVAELYSQILKQVQSAS